MATALLSDALWDLVEPFSPIPPVHSPVRLHRPREQHDVAGDLTPDEAADLLRTTRKAIYVKIERRQLPGVTRMSKRILIRTQHLLDWLHQECASSLQE